MTNLEILANENMKNIQKNKKKYIELLESGISYNNLKALLEYDYEVYLKKINILENIDIDSENVIYKLNELNYIQTDIISDEDAICKYKALTFAKDSLIIK